MVLVRGGAVSGGGAKVTISPNPARSGDVVTWSFSGFPPNVQLKSMGGGTGGIGSSPVVIGTTDANGNLVIQGGPDMPIGNTVLYAVFVATNPEIFAVTTYSVVA